MNIKNRGFSLLVSIIASLILMGVSVGIITSIVRTLDQVNNIARANQTFFATESAYENALFHHGVRGGGLDMTGGEINHENINANVRWSIDGRTSDEISGEMSENEKITIPLNWDNAAAPDENITRVTMPRGQRILLKLAFSDQQPFDNTDNSSFNFGTMTNDVLFVWSVSRVDAVDGLQTFSPITLDPLSDPCGSNTSFYCKSNFSGVGSPQHFTQGVIDFNSGTTNGEILPGNTQTDLRAFMNDANSSNYEISFQPILPFTATGGTKIPHLYYKLYSTSTLPSIPKNIFDVVVDVDYDSFDKTSVFQVKEQPSVGAFDFIIFQ